MCCLGKLVQASCLHIIDETRHRNVVGNGSEGLHNVHISPQTGLKVREGQEVLALDVCLGFRTQRLPNFLQAVSAFRGLVSCKVSGESAR